MPLASGRIGPAGHGGRRHPDSGNRLLRRTRTLDAHIADETQTAQRPRHFVGIPVGRGVVQQHRRYQDRVRPRWATLRLRLLGPDHLDHLVAAKQVSHGDFLIGRDNVTRELRNDGVRHIHGSSIPPSRLPELSPKRCRYMARLLQQTGAL